MLVAVTALALAAAQAPYATPVRAMREAVRDAVATDVRGARVAGIRLGCIGGVEVGERGTCSGSFGVRLHGRVTHYVLTVRSRVLRTAADTVEAVLSAKRHEAQHGGLPRRVHGTATSTGPRPPTERTVHANLVLDRGGARRTLSRRTWVGFPVPFWWKQAYAEGPLTLTGTVEHLYDVPPGGTCAVQLGLSARLTAEPPAEEHDVRRSEIGYDAVRSEPAPPGVGPPELGHLVLVAHVEQQLDRWGAVTVDGYPPLQPTPAQQRRCDQLEARAAERLIPRALAEARPSARPRPPKADPDDEAPTPVDREY